MSRYGTRFDMSLLCPGDQVVYLSDNHKKQLGTVLKVEAHFVHIKTKECPLQKIPSWLLQEIVSEEEKESLEME